LHAIDDTLQQNNLSFQEHFVQLKSDYESITGQLTGLQQEFNSLTEMMNSRSNEFNQHNISCIQQQNKISTIIRDQAFKTNLIESLNRNILTNTGEVEQVNIRIRELLESSSEFDEQLVQLYTEKDELDAS